MTQTQRVTAAEVTRVTEQSQTRDESATVEGKMLVVQGETERAISNIIILTKPLLELKLYSMVDQPVA
jgi:hypothetical protein